MVLVVTVHLVTTLGRLVLAVDSFTCLLSHYGQASTHAGQERLQVATDHVDLPGNCKVELQCSLGEEQLVSKGISNHLYII